MSRQKTRRVGLPRTVKMVRRFIPYLQAQRSTIALSLLALLAGMVFRLLEPWPLKFVLDRVVLTNRPEGLEEIPFLEALSPSTLLWCSALAVVVFSGLWAMTNYFKKVGFALIGSRALTQVRGDLFRHLQRLSLSFHNKARCGDLIVRITGDINMLKDVASTAILPLLASVLIVLVMTGVMFWLHWRLALIALAITPLFFLSTVLLSRRIREAARKQRRREGDMAATASESIGAMKVAQALSLEEQFASDFSSRNEKSLKEGVKTSRLSAQLERTVDMLIAIATALVLWYGARLVLRGELTPGSLLVFLTYLKRTFRPMKDFAKYAGRLAKATAAAERVFDILDKTPDIVNLPHAVAAPAFTGSIRFEGVRFAYEPGHDVLKHIDFSIPPGQRVALVGESGIGKSTIISLILRLYDPLEGRVLIDGRDVRDYTLESLRTQMSVVLQDSLLFATSVRDNIAYGAKDPLMEDVVASAKLASAHRFIEELPGGYDSVLGERGVTLSQGQRQRIVVARAAIRKSPILLLDEPYTGLDKENAQCVIEAVGRLSKGRTTLLVTHNLSLAAQMDRIFFIEKGCIVENGTHAELLQVQGRYAAMVRLQNSNNGHAVAAQDTHAHSR